MRRPPTRVLMYHGVDRVSRTSDPHGLFVTPDSFRTQVEQVLEAGLVPVGEQAYLAALRGGPLPDRAVLITFDDGYRGVGEHAAPLLESLGVPSILYMPADLVGGRAAWLGKGHRHSLLSAEEIRQLRDLGMTVGAHGSDHSDLTRVTDADLRRQTRDTRRALGDLVGEEIRTFAYPFGHHDARVRAAVRDAGYEAAFAVHEPAGRFGIQRVDVNATDTARTFRLKLHRLYPVARRTSRHFPRTRRLAHDLLGREPGHDGAPSRATAAKGVRTS